MFERAHCAPGTAPGSFMLHANLPREVQWLLFPVHRAGNQGSEKFRRSPKFSWPVRDGAGFGSSPLGSQSQRPLLALPQKKALKSTAGKISKYLNFFIAVTKFLFERAHVQKSNKNKRKQSQSRRFHLVRESSYCLQTPKNQTVSSPYIPDLRDCGVSCEHRV